MHTVPASYESCFTIAIFTVLAFAFRLRAARSRSNLRAHSVRVAVFRDGKVDRRTCKNFSQSAYWISVLTASRGQLNWRLGHAKTFAVECSKLHSITVRSWSKIRARRVEIKRERCRTGLLKALEGMPSERKRPSRKNWFSSLLCSSSGQRTGPSPSSKSMLDRG